MTKYGQSDDHPSALRPRYELRPRKRGRHGGVRCRMRKGPFHPALPLHHPVKRPLVSRPDLRPGSMMPTSAWTTLPSSGLTDQRGRGGGSAFTTTTDGVITLRCPVGRVHQTLRWQARISEGRDPKSNTCTATTESFPL